MLFGIHIDNKALEDAKQEVEEVREYYRNKHNEVKEEEPEVEVEVPQDVDVVKEIVKENGYTNYNKPQTVNINIYSAKNNDAFYSKDEKDGNNHKYGTYTYS